MAATKSTTLFSLATVRAYLGLTAAAPVTVTSVTSVGTVATVVAAGHGLVTGQAALLAGVTPAIYNGTWTVTVLDADTVTFILPTTATSPATGADMTLAGPDTAHDVLAAQIADRVSEQFERATGRCFVTRTGETDTWSGDGGAAHFLPFMDVLTVDSVTVDSAAVAADDYFIQNRLGLLRLKAGAFYAGVGNCAAVYSCGRGAQDATTLPSDIVEAALEQVKAIFDEKLAGATGATSVQMGPVTFMVRPGMSYNVRDVLNSWKDVRA